MRNVFGMHSDGVYLKVARMGLRIQECANVKMLTTM